MPISIFGPLSLRRSGTAVGAHGRYLIADSAGGQVDFARFVLVVICGRGTKLAAYCFLTAQAKRHFDHVDHLNHTNHR